eukprot:gene18100-28069_t
MSTEEAEAAKLDAELEAAVADVGGTAGDDGESLFFQDAIIIAATTNAASLANENGRIASA